MKIKTAIIFILAVLLSTILVIGCAEKKNNSAPQYNLPFPSGKMAKYYQERVDSSEFLWLTDVKGAVSAFMNETMAAGKDISIDEIIVKSEGEFHAIAEVPLDTVEFILTLERPNMQKGKKSIWQVTKVEGKPWQKTKSK